MMLYCYLTLSPKKIHFLRYDLFFSVQMLKITPKWQFVICCAPWLQFLVKTVKFYMVLGNYYMLFCYYVLTAYSEVLPIYFKKLRIYSKMAKIA